MIPAEFLGFTKSQNEVSLKGEKVSNHEELMSNFFSQPDALAIGKTKEELKNEDVKEALWGHKRFAGFATRASSLPEGGGGKESEGRKQGAEPGQKRKKFQ